MCPESLLSRGSKFCTCPRYMAMRVSLCPVSVAELCLSLSSFCRLISLCHFRGCLRSYMLMRCQRFRTFAFRREFRPSWQVNVSVIVCILIDWVISLLPRGRFERWSWQIHVVALISQRPHLQYLATNVLLIAPAKRGENHGSPWLVSGNSSDPVHAILPQWCSRPLAPDGNQPILT